MSDIAALAVTARGVPIEEELDAWCQLDEECCGETSVLGCNGAQFPDLLFVTLTGYLPPDVSAEGCAFSYTDDPTGASTVNPVFPGVSMTNFSAMKNASYRMKRVHSAVVDVPGTYSSKHYYLLADSQPVGYDTQFRWDYTYSLPGYLGGPGSNSELIQPFIVSSTTGGGDVFPLFDYGGPASPSQPLILAPTNCSWYRPCEANFVDAYWFLPPSGIGTFNSDTCYNAISVSEAFGTPPEFWVMALTGAAGVYVPGVPNWWPPPGGTCTHTYTDSPGPFVIRWQDLGDVLASPPTEHVSDSFTSTSTYTVTVENSGPSMTVRVWQQILLVIGCEGTSEAEAVPFINCQFFTVITFRTIGKSTRTVTWTANVFDSTSTDSNGVTVTKLDMAGIGWDYQGSLSPLKYWSAPAITEHEIGGAESSVHLYNTIRCAIKVNGGAAWTAPGPGAYAGFPFITVPGPTADSLDALVTLSP
ncbi:MAG: hypothetical protein ACJ8C4_05800 [Gemmataceae bacterium]